MVYYIEINIRSKGTTYTGSYHKEGIHINEYKIVYQTDYKIALNNDWITVLDRAESGERKSSYKHFLEDLDVSIITKEDYFPNGIFASTFTIGDVNSAIKRLTKAMKAKVNSEYGFMFNLDIDRIVESFIKDKL